jgi:UDPglucose 6-dehydrogenase
MDIVVIGTGYVGLVTGVGFSQLGNNVNFIDLDNNKIDKLKAKQLPFFEPGLEELFFNEDNFQRMKFYSEYNFVDWENVDIVFICVQTPNNLDTNSVDTRFLESAIAEIKKIDNSNLVVTIKSTIPPYEIENVCNNVGYNKDQLTFNPEFLREGSAVFDFFNPDRIVIGGNDVTRIEKLKKLYKNFDVEIIVTDPVSSQLIKYLSNTYLPLRLTFANEATRLIKYSNANLEDVLKGVGLDKRIGQHYFRPSPSWGGSCFPKDLVEVNNFYDESLVVLPLISNIIHSNSLHQDWTIDQILGLKSENNLDKIILVGASFKEDTDDIRNSPTIEIYNKLKLNNSILIFDKLVTSEELNIIDELNSDHSNSLISIMFPLSNHLESYVIDFANKNNCIIYYPWK